jgi:hypothetical protein
MQSTHIAADRWHLQSASKTGTRRDSLSQSPQRNEVKFAYTVAAPINARSQFLTLDFKAAASILIVALSITRQPLKPVADHAGVSAAIDSLIKTLSPGLRRLASRSSG